MTNQESLEAVTFGWRRRALFVLGASALIVTVLATVGRAPVATSTSEGRPSVAAAVPAAPSQPASTGPAAEKQAAPAKKELELRPMFDRKMRLESGKPAKLLFVARASGAPASSAEVSISVFHPGEPEHRLPAHEIEEGVYEATFTPHGVGGYRVTLLSGGVPISSAPPVKLGVVGTVGAADPTLTDITGSTSYDPRTTRTGRGRRR
ncbi:MAG: hypothetical protein ACJ79U_22530 [Myxococcales bacterium]